MRMTAEKVVSMKMKITTDAEVKMQLESSRGPEGPQGPAGADGPRGEDGHTPIKGKDYFTDADKTEMVNAVIAALPVYAGEVADA